MKFFKLIRLFKEITLNFDDFEEDLEITESCLESRKLNITLERVFLYHFMNSEHIKLLVFMKDKRLDFVK